MIQTTTGQALIDHALPESMRNRGATLDKKGVASLFDDLARAHPDAYRETAKRLSDVARDVAYGTGGFSFGLSHMRTVPAAEAIKQQIARDVAAIRRRPGMDDAARDKAVIAAIQKHQDAVTSAVFDASRAENNPLAMQVMNVGRGNKTSLRSLRAGDLLYEDHHGNPIPIPALTPYSQGLRPVEYWAAGFGARKSVIDTKFATQNAGFLSKQLNQVAHRLIVTRQDEPEDDPATRRGYPTDVDDRDNEGALLAHAAGTYARNTALTPAILRDIKAQGHSRILVRSPIVGGPSEGGIYARDVGIRERGDMAPPGDAVGIAAAQSLSEKLTQGQLSSKHAGGVAGANAAVSGFKYINQLIQVPKTFPGGATHTQRDGRITSITPAPQGGTYVDVGGEQHYLSAGYTPSHAIGDTVEAGDTISDGIANPAEIVKHKGIGEGRRQFTDSFATAYKNSGMAAHRRNIELLSRGLIDHVEVQDEMPESGHVPGDIVPYQALEAHWTPRDGSRHVNPTQAIGKYIESPVLHHTIGTKLQPSMLSDFADFGVHNVLVHDDPPPFKPIMIRGMANLQHDPDVLTRHLGSNLQKSTLESVHRGRSSDTAGTSYVPAVVDRVNFGRHGLTEGWKPPKIDAPRTPKINEPEKSRAIASVLD